MNTEVMIIWREGISPNPIASDIASVILRAVELLTDLGATSVVVLVSESRG